MRCPGCAPRLRPHPRPRPRRHSRRLPPRHPADTGRLLRPLPRRATADGDLRLDTRAGMLQGSENGVVVVPGDAKGSRLYQRLVTGDPKKRMPRKADPLTAVQIETVLRWIDAGRGLAGRRRPQEATGGAADGERRPRRGIRDAPRRRAATARASPSTKTSARSWPTTASPATAPTGTSGRWACGSIARTWRSRRCRRARWRSFPAIPKRSALLASRHGSGRRGADALRRERQAAPDRGADRHAPPLDRAGRTLAAALVVPPARAPDAAGRGEDATGRATRWTRSCSPASRRRASRPRRKPSARELLRRLSFDLTGLPPDARGAARVPRGPVARVPTSGRWTGCWPRRASASGWPACWLDLVRYADSVGYHSDNSRTVWRYRDYVIGAFNRNLPFDQFTAVQLAGDLLPDASLEQRIASGYNRLLQTTEEGGAQPKEYRAIYLADRVRNASAVWLGATVGMRAVPRPQVRSLPRARLLQLRRLLRGREGEAGGPPRSRTTCPDESPAARARGAGRRDRAPPQASWTSRRARAGGRPGALGGDAARAPARRRWTVLEPVEVSSANGTRVLIQGNDFSLIATHRVGTAAAERHLHRPLQDRRSRA